MFARVKSTVSQITNKIGFGAGWVAGYTVATGKKVSEKTGEAVKATTALTVRTVNQATTATAKAAKTTAEKVTSTAKSAWQAVGKTASRAFDAGVDVWHSVGSFCLRNIDKATWAMLIGVGVAIAATHPAGAMLFAAALYNAALVFALIGLVYLFSLAVIMRYVPGAVPSVA